MSRRIRLLLAIPFLVFTLSSPLLIYAIGSASIITTAAGTDAGFSGDGGPATAAQLEPLDVAIDRANNLYIADFDNHRVRKVFAATGIITTVVGTGTPGFSGDGGPAISAQLKGPASVTLDDAGNLYIADFDNSRIRKVISPTGIITTIAGIGTYGYSGDGGLATAAEMATPYSIALDKSGDLYIADGASHRVRKVIAATGIITTVAGNGNVYSGDGGLATAAGLTFPVGVAFDKEENLYIASGDRIRKMFAATGIITTVAGTGTGGFSGDGGAATIAKLNQPSSLVVDEANNLYIADENNHRIRKIMLATGIITTVAGSGIGGLSGDGGLATVAQLNHPTGLALDGLGHLYITDLSNYRIRKLEDPKIFLPIIIKDAEISTL